MKKEKTKMRKKELEERYGFLEVRLDALSRRYEKLEDRVNNDHKVLEFISNHDRNAVIIVDITEPYAIFVWDMKTFVIELPHDVTNKCVYSVLDNSPTSCIIMADNFTCPTFYKLDKTTQSFVDVTEFYKKAEFERNANACDELKSQKFPTEEKCECKCNKGSKK